MSGVYGLDWNPIIHAADAMEIKTDEWFFRLLRTFEDVLIDETNKKN